MKKELEDLVKDLVVIGETDSPVEVFWTRNKFDDIEWDDFFNESGYTQQNPKWKEVRNLMEKNLDRLEVRKVKNRKGYRYEAFGYDEDGNIFGVNFFAVET